MKRRSCFGVGSRLDRRSSSTACKNVGPAENHVGRNSPIHSVRSFGAHPNRNRYALTEKKRNKNVQLGTSSIVGRQDTGRAVFRPQAKPSGHFASEIEHVAVGDGHEL